MDLLYEITSLFFFLWIIRSILFWIYLWQLKEYRLDRFRVHLVQTRSGKDLFVNIFNGIKFFFFAFFFFAVVFGTTQNWYYYITAAIYIYSAFLVIKELIERKFKRPRTTVKAATLFIITLCIVGLFYYLHLLTNYLWLFVIEAMIPFAVTAWVSAFWFPSEFAKDIIINRAAKKLADHAEVTKIGITGSYGKGSTKEYTAAILSAKFDVLKTPQSDNTAIGIAKTILNNKDWFQRFFIAEMGAYQRGEITELCSLVRPTIGILTAVSEQHSSLFGGIEAIMSTKYELIESLPKDGLALFNGNNKNVFALYKKTKIKKVLYYVDYENNGTIKADIIAYNIVEKKDYIYADIKSSQIKRPIKAHIKIIGKHNLENILPGIYLGLAYKMTESEIKKGLSIISPATKTMMPYKLASGTVVIDDTFNISPASIRAALSYMKLYSGKKVIVLEPMIELGREASAIHFEIGKEIGELCDYCIITNKNYYKPLKNGIMKSGNTCQLYLMETSQIAEFIQLLKKDDIVVLEGKQSALPLKKISYERFY